MWKILLFIHLFGFVSRTIRNYYIYKLLSNTVDVLEYYNIEYILDWGSLLGAYRNNEVIYNDDDCDISVIDCDAKLIEELLTSRLRFGIKQTTNSISIIPNKYINLHLDIYFINMDKNGNYTNLNRCVPKELINQKSKIRFGNREYCCPYKIKEYLLVLYKYIGTDAIETDYNDYVPYKTNNYCIK